MNAEERANIRELHHREEGYATEEGSTFYYCYFCEDTDWPCVMIELLDALEAAEADNAAWFRQGQREATERVIALFEAVSQHPRMDVAIEEVRDRLKEPTVDIVNRAMPPEPQEVSE